ncbi:hypothetical protein D3C72_889950 [compost metagenome]
MRFNDRQRRQGTGLAFDGTVGELLDVVGVHACCAFQQAAVQVEHVAWVRFTSWWTAQQQRDLTVCNSLFGQIIVDDQCIFTAVTEVFAHGATGVRRDVLHGGRFRSGSGDNDGVFHRAVLFQRAHDVLDRRGFLANRDVDTLHALAFLIDDRINRHSRLAGLTVANDQFALAAANWNHRIDRLQAGLHWLRNGFTGDHAWGDFFNRGRQFGFDGAFAVDRLAQRVDNAAEQLRTDWHFQNAAGALHRVAFGDVLVGTQNHGTDGVAFQIHCQAKRVAWEFQHLALHHVRQTVDAADTVGDGNNRALITHFSAAVKTLDPALDQLADFRWVELHTNS